MTTILAWVRPKNRHPERRLVASLAVSGLAVGMVVVLLALEPRDRSATLALGVVMVVSLAATFAGSWPWLVWLGVGALGACVAVGLVTDQLAPAASLPLGIGLWLVAEVGYSAASGVARPRASGRLDLSRAGYLAVVAAASVGVGALALSIPAATGSVAVVLELAGLVAAVVVVALVLALWVRPEP
ncbi:MAG: hypothetical protein ACRD0Z_07805 [Acidimicrobiales bacterium]